MKMLGLNMQLKSCSNQLRLTQIKNAKELFYINSS